MDHTITMRDVRAICALSDHATRRLFSDLALSKTFIERPGPSGGRPRRFWRLVSLIPVLRAKEFFTAKMERELADLDSLRRKEKEYA